MSYYFSLGIYNYYQSTIKEHSVCLELTLTRINDIYTIN